MKTRYAQQKNIDGDAVGSDILKLTEWEDGGSINDDLKTCFTGLNDYLSITGWSSNFSNESTDLTSASLSISI